MLGQKRWLQGGKSLNGAFENLGALFKLYLQRTYRERVPDYKLLERGLMKETNAATEPRISIHLFSKAEDRPGCSALEFFYCVLFHIWPHFLGSQPPESFYFFVGGGGKKCSGNLLRFWWQPCAPSRKMHTGTHTDDSVPESEARLNPSRLSPHFPEKRINCPWL